jgi:hypothetical protein
MVAGEGAIVTTWVSGTDLLIPPVGAFPWIRTAVEKQAGVAWGEKAGGHRLFLL